MKNVPHHNYTEEEHQFMREFVPGHSRTEIRDEFNKRFGTNLTVGQVKGYMHRFGLKTGRDGRFQKGHVPWQKGKKLSEEQKEKLKPTWFKVGSLPYNTVPVGTEALLSDGYVWVKVNDIPKAKKQVNWEQKQRLIWAEHYGPVPDDCFIIFKDGDRMNFDIDNLACVSKAVHIRMNQKGLRSSDPELTEIGITLAELATAIGKKQKEVRR